MKWLMFVVGTRVAGGLEVMVLVKKRKMAEDLRFFPFVV